MMVSTRRSECDLGIELFIILLCVEGRALVRMWVGLTWTTCRRTFQGPPPRYQSPPPVDRWLLKGE